MKETKGRITNRIGFPNFRSVSKTSRSAPLPREHLRPSIPYFREEDVLHIYSRDYARYCLLFVQNIKSKELRKRMLSRTGQFPTASKASKTNTVSSLKCLRFIVEHPNKELSFVEIQKSNRRYVGAVRSAETSLKPLVRSSTNKSTPPEYPRNKH